VYLGQGPWGQWHRWPGWGSPGTLLLGQPPRWRCLGSLRQHRRRGLMSIHTSRDQWRTDVQRAGLLSLALDGTSAMLLLLLLPAAAGRIGGTTPTAVPSW
jgi:hypothetical protein